MFLFYCSLPAETTLLAAETAGGAEAAGGAGANKQ